MQPNSENELSLFNLKDFLCFEVERVPSPRESFCDQLFMFLIGTYIFVCFYHVTYALHVT